LLSSDIAVFSLVDLHSLARKQYAPLSWPSSGKSQGIHVIRSTIKQCRRALFVGMLALFTLPSGIALAQPAAAPYPSKSIRFLVGFPPGGGADTLARLIGKHLSQSWGRAFVIENRPGADSTIATELGVKAAPDGYTIIFITNAHVITPFQRQLPYDPVKDVAPITLVASGPNLLLVHPTLPVKTLKDFIALARARPNELSFGSSGTGTSPYLAMELLKSMANIKMVHIPYKGTGLALIDLTSGQIQTLFGAISTTLPFVNNDRLRALAVSSRTRITQMPTVPTVAEAALPGFEAATWYGVVAPAGLQADVLQKLHAGIHSVLQLPEARDYMATLGFYPAGEGPKEFAEIIRADLEKWARVIRQLPNP
jgi:tripartite-type tricarboxylate transporter receptor subunit TctC